MKLYAKLCAIYVALTRRTSSTKQTYSQLGLLDDNVNTSKQNYGTDVVTVYDDQQQQQIADDDKVLGDASARREPTFRQQVGLAMREWRKRMRENLRALRGIKMRRKSTRPRSFSAL